MSLFRRARTSTIPRQRAAPPERVAPPGYRDVPPVPWDPQSPVDPAEAVAFIEQFYCEHPDLDGRANGGTGSPAARRPEIRPHPGAAVSSIGVK